MNKNDFDKYVDLAVKILKTETEYIFDRNVIDKIFTIKYDEFSKEVIATRLSIIDSFYSTNMGKRLFGISDLADAIYQIGDDKEVKKEITNFLKNEDSKIDILLTEVYGIYKNGKDRGEARSLISKYLYFLTVHKFPIEDSLVKKNINIVAGKIFNERINSKNDILKEIIKFTNKHNVSYDEFDNFMWLLGKINKGSLSLVLNKENYLKLVRKTGINENNSQKFDKAMAEKLKSLEFVNSLKDIVSNDVLTFLKFNIELRN